MGQKFCSLVLQFEPSQVADKPNTHSWYSTVSILPLAKSNIRFSYLYADREAYMHFTSPLLHPFMLKVCIVYRLQISTHLSVHLV